MQIYCNHSTTGLCVACTKEVLPEEPWGSNPDWPSRIEPLRRSSRFLGRDGHEYVVIPVMGEGRWIFQIHLWPAPRGPAALRNWVIGAPALPQEPGECDETYCRRVHATLMWDSRYSFDPVEWSSERCGQGHMLVRLANNIVDGGGRYTERLRKRYENDGEEMWHHADILRDIRWPEGWTGWSQLAHNLRAQVDGLGLSVTWEMIQQTLREEAARRDLEEDEDMDDDPRVTQDSILHDFLNMRDDLLDAQGPNSPLRDIWEPPREFRDVWESPRASQMSFQEALRNFEQGGTQSPSREGSHPPRAESSLDARLKAHGLSRFAGLVNEGDTFTPPQPLKPQMMPEARPPEPAPKPQVRKPTLKSPKRFRSILESE